MTDWAVGDLALCVDDAPRGTWQLVVHVERGRTYRVMGIGPTPLRTNGPIVLWPEGVFAESLGGAPAFYMIDRFRKIKPDAAEPCEAEFTILLQLSKQRVCGVGR